MTETQPPGVLIIGGGVAGMAAARLLSGFEASVHIVEKQERLGGHAARWACMATDACLQCGACLSMEMAEQAAAADRVALHLGARILKIQRNEGGFAVDLDSGQSLSVKKIITATGFSPFDATQNSSYHAGELPNVITTADLNDRLRNESMDGILGKQQAPEIAFIQCVGSRNRKIGADYCSQVCCKISMRHANKLLHLYPEAKITIFYMDLQVIGKEVRDFYAGLSGSVALVQGVPAEILANGQGGKLRIVTEDRSQRVRKTRHFDLAVLSVGMRPAETMEETTGLLALSPNPWGFFNTSVAPPHAPDIHVAGCARTPGDILFSMQDGRLAASRVIRELELAPAPAGAPGGPENGMPAVAVLGDGPQASSVARLVAADGCRTWLLGAPLQADPAADEPAGLSVEPDAAVYEVSGTAGNFTVSYTAGGRREKLSCGALIAAFEPHHAGIDAGFGSENAVSSEAFSSMAKNNPENLPDSIAILLDYAGHENKALARTAMEDALRARVAGKTVYVIARKMLVHKADGQRLFDRAKKEGIYFLRYENGSGIGIEKTASGFALTVDEATLPTDHPVRVDCGLLVFPRQVMASPGFPDKARLLRERVDREGFLQSPNVRHRLTRSTRRGVFFAGSGHDETDADDLRAETEDILAHIRALTAKMVASEPSADSFGDPGVVINERMCAKCLTCYRICPHGAIVLNDKMKPQIDPAACFSCHLCMASCPAHAIESEAFANDAFAEMAEKDRTVLFACERSAYLAADEAPLPETVKLVSIPCACRMNVDVMLKTLLGGASRVMVAGCHDGNCRSMEGAKEAAYGVRQALRIPGMDGSRVSFFSAAANEAARIGRILSKT